MVVNRRKIKPVGWVIGVLPNEFLSCFDFMNGMSGHALSWRRRIPDLIKSQIHCETLCTLHIFTQNQRRGMLRSDIVLLHDSVLLPEQSGVPMVDVWPANFGWFWFFGWWLLSLLPPQELDRGPTDSRKFKRWEP